jgi:O6-methylguanine-DNA--protein-cysteine methyltransferase
VLRSDGTLGGYIGGLQTKAALLSLESGSRNDTTSARR